MYSHTCCADYTPCTRLYTVLNCIYWVVLHIKTNCQIITQKSVNFLRSFWKNLHWTEKNYTGTVRGARDKYEVCVQLPKSWNWTIQKLQDALMWQQSTDTFSQTVTRILRVHLLIFPMYYYCSLASVHLLRSFPLAFSFNLWNIFLIKIMKTVWLFWVS